MKLTLRDLSITTTLGIFPEEQNSLRDFMLNAEIEYDAAEAARMDDVAYAIDYTMLENELRVFAKKKHWNLVETLAYALAEFLVGLDDKITEATVTIDKPQAVKHAASVALTATYKRK